MNTARIGRFSRTLRSSIGWKASGWAGATARGIFVVVSRAFVLHETADGDRLVVLGHDRRCCIPLADDRAGLRGVESCLLRQRRNFLIDVQPDEVALGDPRRETERDAHV